MTGAYAKAPGAANQVLGARGLRAGRPEANSSLNTARGFSFGFVLLNLFPYFLLFIFGLAAGVKFGYFSLNKALAALLAVLVAAYFALPRMAMKVEDSIFLKNIKGKTKRRN